jgi:uridine kinase
MNKPYLIAIDGFGAGGKSTLAENLARELQNCPVIPMDDFCFPPSQEDDGMWWGKDVEGYGVNWEKFQDEVLGQVDEDFFSYYALDWDKYTYTNKINIKIMDYLIIEGLQALREEYRDKMNFKIWVNTPLDNQMERAYERDGDFMMPFWESDFTPMANLYYKEHRPDLCADMTYSLGDDIETILNEIKKRT